jgi:signal transduction histidine kinase
MVAAAMLLPCSALAQASDYKQSKEYLMLRDSVYHSFNEGDSARFFRAVSKLENYLVQQDDLHAYYTQRCNEIVFLLNRERIFEAYKLAQRLSKELTDRKLDSEMYMAINMMGHIYRYCGNKESAKRCFWEVIRRMQQEGYIESQPPIYMNLVNIVVGEDPDEALRLIEQALSIAREASPERVFDIETRRTLVYYTTGDIPHFLEGYKAYKQGVAEGKSSVHGRTLEVYFLAQQGRIDEAAKMALTSDDDPFETQAEIYSRAGRWHEAYDALKLGAAESDSINSLILSSSMQGIQDELRLYESERERSRLWFYAIAATAFFLLLLVVALVYIVQSRRRHLREIRKAYRQILESEKMKSEFIQNVSHEVRTPLNVISGFAQVLAHEENDLTTDDRHHIADTMMHNTHLITNMINEVLEISRGENLDVEMSVATIHCNELLRQLAGDFHREHTKGNWQLTFESALPDSFTIVTQEGALPRILTPLLDNALKYAPDGHTVLRATASDTQLMISVEDDGPGIPADKAAHIFDRFVKLDTFKEGLGLGLTFSRTMARRIGGDVVLDTAYKGPGARFVVIVPRSK